MPDPPGPFPPFSQSVERVTDNVLGKKRVKARAAEPQAIPDRGKGVQGLVPPDGDRYSEWITGRGEGNG